MPNVEYHPTIPLERYIQELITHERELRERSVADARRALDIQTAEIGRRLENLNGAHERTEKTQARMEATYITRETFEAYAKSLTDASNRQREDDDAWKQSINKVLDEARGASNRQVYLITLFLAVLTLALRFVPVS